MTEFPTSSLELAIYIAKKSFDGKVDKGGEPYINHCLRVKDSIFKAHCAISEDVLCVAILHDLMEDCEEWTPDVLRHFFNTEIVNAIWLLTKHDEPYDEYIEKLSRNHIAAIVKLHDLKDNLDLTRLHTLGEQDLKRLARYHKAYLKLKK